MPPGGSLPYGILNAVHLRKVLIEQNWRLCEEHRNARLVSAGMISSLVQTNRATTDPQQTNMQTSHSQKAIIEKNHPSSYKKKKVKRQKKKHKKKQTLRKVKTLCFALIAFETQF